MVEGQESCKEGQEEEPPINSEGCLMSEHFIITAQEREGEPLLPVCDFKIGDAVKKYSDCAEAVAQIESWMQDRNSPWKDCLRYRIERVVSEPVKIIDNPEQVKKQRYIASVVDNLKALANEKGIGGKT